MGTVSNRAETIELMAHYYLQVKYAFYFFLWLPTINAAQLITLKYKLLNKLFVYKQHLYLFIFVYVGLEYEPLK